MNTKKKNSTKEENNEEYKPSLEPKDNNEE